MKCNNIFLGFLFLSFALIFSCKPNNSETTNTPENVEDLDKDTNKESPSFSIAETPLKEKYPTQHAYGGWSCPDNLRGFPPIDIKDLDKISVVKGLIAKNPEDRNGNSLLFFKDNKTTSHLDIKLPKLARYYSEYTTKNELVAIIEAVVADNDTVVAFRYMNGGNGSAYLGEISFISDEEKEKLGSLPYVNEEVQINASRPKVWDVITGKKYAKTLGEVFDKGAFIESDWQANATVNFVYEPDKVVSTGLITALWQDMYIQVDYNFNGYHYTEKFLLLANSKINSTKFHVAAGPYTTDYDAQKVVWAKWLQKVKALSESI